MKATTTLFASLLAQTAFGFSNQLLPASQSESLYLSSSSLQFLGHFNVGILFWSAGFGLSHKF